MTINLELIQNPSEAQLSELAAIHATCFPKGWNSADIGEMLKVKGTFLVAGEGAFGMVRALAGEAEILTVAVIPEGRGKGAGKAIVDKMIAAVRPLAEAVFLEVRESNVQALSLYERAGFTLLSRRKNYYTKPDGSSEDAIVMRLEMSAD